MWIKSYIITLVSVALLFAVFEILMPNTNMKKYISLIAGIVALFTIIKPVVSFPKHILEDISFELESNAEYTSSQISESITNSLSKEIDNNFQKSLSSAIELSVEQVCNIKCKATPHIEDGMVKYVYIDSQKNEAIEKHIKENFGLVCYFKES